MCLDCGCALHSLSLESIACTTEVGDRWLHLLGETNRLYFLDSPTLGISM